MAAPILIPAFTAPNKVTCLPGYDKLLVATILDPTVPGQEVAVTLNGVTYTSGVNLTLTGHGAPIILWTGVINPAVPRGVQSYPWTCAQTISGTTWTDSGTFWSRPGDGDDFAFFFAGCDNNSHFSHYNGAAPEKTVGYWQHLKRYAQSEALPVVGLFFVDDYGYVDSVEVYDDFGYAGESGLHSSGKPSTTLQLNDYLLGWAAILGMMGPAQTTGFTAEEISPGIIGSDFFNFLMWGREEHRSWCRKNINLWLQWGDHEFKNDQGWSNLNTTYPNPRFTSAGVDGVAVQAWDALFGLIAPPLVQSLDTTARPWVMEVGPVCLAAMDKISSAVGDAAVGYSPPTTGMTVFGSDQIVDTLNAVYALNKPFNIFGMSTSMRYLGAGPNYSLFNHGGQSALYNHALPEYQRLVTLTGQTPKAIMDDRISNSGVRNYWMYTGDHHFGQALQFRQAAYGGNAPEFFCDVHLGTVNGSATHQSTQNTVEGETLAGIQIDYAQHFYPTLTAYNPVASGTFHGMRTEVYGAPAIKECHVYLLNHEDTVRWSRKFVQYGDNRGYEIADNSWRRLSAPGKSKALVK